MNEEMEIVENVPETNGDPEEGHNDQLVENIRKILLEKIDPLPFTLSGQHPDKFNSSDPTTSFRKASFADIPTYSPAASIAESCSNCHQNQHGMQATDSLSSPQSVSKEQFSDALKHLEIYEDLTNQLHRYTSLLENAEKQQYSVGSSTYEKVRNEYAEKQSSLLKQREEQKALLQREIKKLLQGQSQLGEVCEEKEDQIEEIAFRLTVSSVKTKSSQIGTSFSRSCSRIQRIWRKLAR
jgi:hypothetical protein